NPSYREMAARGRELASATTIWKVLKRGDFPSRFKVVEAIVEGCGGTDADRERFATAWRHLTMPPKPAPPRVRATPPAGKPA
ncbi:MAG TPA: hypothetical protein VGS19_24425, partial [Streptosporangiaceae bacterium]|nr:hypothetical protein [Streptosporangiaceae bacterium]